MYQKYSLNTCATNAYIGITVTQAIVDLAGNVYKPRARPSIWFTPAYYQPGPASVLYSTPYSILITSI